MPQRKKRSTPKTRKLRKSTELNKHEFWHSKLIVTNVDLWNCQVTFSVNQTEREILDTIVGYINTNDDRNEAREQEFLTELVKGLGGWDATPSHTGRMIPCGASYVVLLRFSKDKFREAIGILAHEVTHVAQYLLRHRRVPLIEETEEVHAYLTEYLMKEALYALYD